jgi:hypothetical protein
MKTVLLLFLLSLSNPSISGQLRASVRFGIKAPTNPSLVIPKKSSKYTVTGLDCFFSEEGWIGMPDFLNTEPILNVVPFDNSPNIGNKFIMTANGYSHFIEGMSNAINIDKRLKLAKISDLENYIGKAQIIEVMDATRGGVFNLKNAINNVVDSGVVFSSKYKNKVWVRNIEKDIFARWYNAKGDDLSDNLIPFTNAIVYCQKFAKDLIIDSGIFRMSLYFPVRQIGNPTTLKDYHNITIKGKGRKTVLKTVFATGADVLQLNAVKNLKFNDLAITGVKTDVSINTYGINGISITNGGENIFFENIHCFDLPYIDKKTYIDGSKAFTIQVDKNVKDIHFTNCSSQNVAFGFNLTLFSKKVKYSNIYFENGYLDCFYRGIVLDTPNDYNNSNEANGNSCYVNNNTVINAQLGLEVVAMNNCYVNNNTFINTSTVSPIFSWDTEKIGVKILGTFNSNFKNNIFNYTNVANFSKVGGGGISSTTNCEFENTFIGNCREEAVKVVVASGEFVKNTKLKDRISGNRGSEYDSLLFKKFNNNLILRDKLSLSRQKKIDSANYVPSESFSDDENFMALMIPRLSTIQREELNYVDNGMQIYNTTLGLYQFRENGIWNNQGSSPRLCLPYGSLTISKSGLKHTISNNSKILFDANWSPSRFMLIREINGKRQYQQNGVDYRVTINTNTMTITTTDLYKSGQILYFYFY